MSLPILYKLDKKGEIRYWECNVEGDVYYTRAGVWKNRDTHKWKEHKRAARYTPNHGAYKSSEEVALEHAQSAWSEKKRNDCMVESIDDLLDPSRQSYQIPLAPVLAVKYKDLIERHDKYNAAIAAGEKPRVKFCFEKGIQYYVEPKYDGERMTVAYCKYGDDVEPDVHFFSRLRVEIPGLNKLREVWRKIYTAFSARDPRFKDWQFDGEIIDPG
jgi:hypothetical protein